MIKKNSINILFVLILTRAMWLPASTKEYENRQNDQLTTHVLNNFNTIDAQAAHQIAALKNDIESNPNSPNRAEFEIISLTCRAIRLESSQAAVAFYEQWKANLPHEVGLQLYQRVDESLTYYVRATRALAKSVPVENVQFWENHHWYFWNMRELYRQQDSLLQKTLRVQHQKSSIIRTNGETHS